MRRAIQVQDSSPGYYEAEMPVSDGPNLSTTKLKEREKVKLA